VRGRVVVRWRNGQKVESSSRVYAVDPVWWNRQSQRQEKKGESAQQRSNAKTTVRDGVRKRKGGGRTNQVPSAVCVVYAYSENANRCIAYARCPEWGQERQVGKKRR